MVVETDDAMRALSYLVRSNDACFDIQVKRLKKKELIMFVDGCLFVRGESTIQLQSKLANGLTIPIAPLLTSNYLFTITQFPFNSFLLIP